MVDSGDNYRHTIFLGYFQCYCTYFGEFQSESGSDQILGGWWTSVMVERGIFTGKIILGKVFIFLFRNIQSLLAGGPSGYFPIIFCVYFQCYCTILWWVSVGSGSDQILGGWWTSVMVERGIFTGKNYSRKGIYIFS